MTLIFIVIILIIISFDQLSKRLAIKYLSNAEKKVILKNKLEFTLVKNYGAAYNILSNKQRLLIVITFPLLVIMFIYLLTIIKTEGKLLLEVGLVFIIGGGFSNLLDRIKRGYVIDFIYFNIKKFPVFNFADFFIIGGAAMLLISGY